MITHPELVRDIHQDYIEAGADIITTNTSSTGRDVLEGAGLEHKVAEANRLGIDAAVVEAEAELGLPVWVGLSVFRDGNELCLGIQDRHGRQKGRCRALVTQ